MGPCIWTDPQIEMIYHNPYLCGVQGVFVGHKETKKTLFFVAIAMNS